MNDTPKKHFARSVIFAADCLRHDAIAHGYSRDPEYRELMSTMQALQSKLLRELREQAEEQEQKE